MAGDAEYLNEVRAKLERDECDADARGSMALLIKKTKEESMDFEETESVMWRKHQLRRFFQDRGHWWTTTRKTTAWKWILVILTGILIGLMGFFVLVLTHTLTIFKFETVDSLISSGQWASAFFSFLFLCLFYSSVAGFLCYLEPNAVGSGIPDVKAYLNGININKIVRIRVLFAKVIGMCFSCASGLPLGKEGPMIHAGSIVGAAVSQGKTITFGFDTSWTKFQDLRNDRSKRDFVTFGAAAAVAAAFSAPIGGILFTLEEGASFWSTTLTFRAFFCAMITQLTFSSLSSTFVTTNSGLAFQTVSASSSSSGVFAFGSFQNATYASYELILFILIGAAGGVMGAFFNRLNKEVTILRKKYLAETWKKFAELIIITATFSTICFVLPLIWDQCTAIPIDTSDYTQYQQTLLGDLMTYECGTNQYNQLASLYMVDSDVAMQQLFHFQEGGGTTYLTFSTGALVLFFLPYFLMAAITSGTFCPAGLFVPTLLSGAAYGRLIGHILNVVAPAGVVAESGTYALIGAAAVLGGMSRMTIAGTVIILEAAGSPNLLLPLMLTFAAARYSGNAINTPMYDMHIELKELPFLEGQLKTLGLLNYHPVMEIMARPVVTVDEINRVGKIYDILVKTKHNGFPVISRTGHLRGLILRKHLCSLLKCKAFTPADGKGSQTAAAVFHDQLERNYPRYPKISEIELNTDELSQRLDLRAYMDTAVYSINESSSIQKCYRFFRTMGLRHLVVVDGDHKVTGMITRHDITEHRLEHHWFREGENLQRFINVSPMDDSTSGLLRRDDEEAEGCGRFDGESGIFRGDRSTDVVDDHTFLSKRAGLEDSSSGPIDVVGVEPKHFQSTHVPFPAIAEMSPNPLLQKPLPPSSGFVTAAPQRNRDRATREPKSNKTLI